eukprot:tig00021501_g21957.t1
MGGTSSKISSWRDEASCVAKETPLYSLKVARYAVESDLLNACLAKGATFASASGDTTLPCTQCPAVTKVETFSAPDCSGTSLFTATYKGEALSDQDLFTSCGRGAALGKVGTAYYKAAAGDMGGTEAACTKCPPVTGVFTYTDGGCTNKGPASYYYGALAKGAPALSADEACDAKGALAFSAKAFAGESATPIVGCTPCPARSIVRAYPSGNCTAGARDAVQAAKDARLSALLEKSLGMRGLEEVRVAQDAALQMARIVAAYGGVEALQQARGAAVSKPEGRTAADEAAIKAYDDFTAASVRHEGLTGGLTEAEVDEAFRLALDVVDDPYYVSATERVVDGKPAAVLAAVKELCEGGFKYFLGWRDGDSSALSNALYDTDTPFDATFSVAKGTDLGQEMECSPCRTHKKTVECIRNGTKVFDAQSADECRSLYDGVDENEAYFSGLEVESLTIETVCTPWGGCEEFREQLWVLPPWLGQISRVDEARQEAEGGRSWRPASSWRRPSSPPTSSSPPAAPRCAPAPAPAPAPESPPLCGRAASPPPGAQDAELAEGLLPQ